jgi:threonine dehydrogenase-like Zn-dependent dehydrogenase
MVTTIIHDLENEEKFTSEIALPILTDPQKIGSCITYFRRYNIVSIFALPQEDDDGNTASGHTTKKVEVEKAWLNEKDPAWQKAIDHMSTASGKLSDIQKRYKVSKELQVKLLNGGQ